MQQPRILISGASDGWANYEKAVALAGGLPFGAYCPPCDLSYDGLLLSGGEDVLPARFGQEHDGTLDTDPDRDAAEFALAEAYLAAGKPILGICRGHQVLNIALGGTLRQDIGPELCLFHRRMPEADRDKLHPIRTAGSSLLAELYGPLCMVNSSHHQAVDRLGRGLRAAAWAESGLVEAMEHDSLPVLCVQFHPERMRHGDTAEGGPIFQHFIRLCKGEAYAK